jgi:hypothetical protein
LEYVVNLSAGRLEGYFWETNMNPGDRVKIKPGGHGIKWTPCAGMTGTLVKVPEREDERYGYAVRFEEPVKCGGMTVSYHREEVELSS